MHDSTCDTIVHIRVGGEGRTPIYATAGSAGCDLYAARGLTLLPGECKVLPLDLVMAIEPGVEAQIRPRSGLSLKTELRLPNSPGTIDSDYRSEVGVLLQNTFSMERMADQILFRPQLLEELAAKYHRVPYIEYLKERLDLLPNNADQENLLKLAKNLSELSEKSIWLDSQGNPYGTIYIQPGDRIAQMVFSKYLKAAFVEHPWPEHIGQDRGGGFGSTGIRQETRANLR